MHDRHGLCNIGYGSEQKSAHAFVSDSVWSFILWWFTVNLIDDGEIFGTGCCYKPAAGVLLQLLLQLLLLLLLLLLLVQLLLVLQLLLLLLVLQLLLVCCSCSCSCWCCSCSCSCLATAAAHSLLLVLQLLLQLSSHCQLLLTGLTALRWKRHYWNGPG